jgi:hypothetical protein
MFHQMSFPPSDMTPQSDVDNGVVDIIIAVRTTTQGGPGSQLLPRNPSQFIIMETRTMPTSWLGEKLWDPQQTTCITIRR